MAKYESQYKELTFYVKDVAYQFSNGKFSTDNEDFVEVLDKSPLAQRVEEAPKKAPAKPKATTKKAE